MSINDPLAERTVSSIERIASACEGAAIQFASACMSVANYIAQNQTANPSRQRRRGIRTRSAHRAPTVVPTELDRMRASAALKKAGITKP